MIDIQSENFIADFKMSDATVGTIGYGFIGKAVVELFKPHCNVLAYDKARTDLNTLDDVVAKSELIFVAVPTPMQKTGECFTGIVESVFQDIQNSAVKTGRDLGAFVAVLKSTVPPGFTKKMQDRYAIRIVFSPEFLTEANAVNDFITTNRILLGGDIEDARIVYKYFEGVWPDRQYNTWSDHPDGPVAIIQCDSTEAEMVKLSTNVHLTARVMISNELYLICQKLGVDYDTVKVLTQIDKRIGMSHMNVPGPDGHCGIGGHCFWKDLNNLRFVSEEKLQLGKSLFSSLAERNLEIRDDRNWESQPDRAVVKDV